MFAEFDCPFTTFLTTGFLDRTLWFWWDRIEYVFCHAVRRERPGFNYLEYDEKFLTPERKAELIRAVADGDAYMLGGFSAERRGLGTLRTEL